MRSLVETGGERGSEREQRQHDPFEVTELVSGCPDGIGDVWIATRATSSLQEGHVEARGVESTTDLVRCFHTATSPCNLRTRRFFRYHPTWMELPAGTRVGRYEVRRLLGGSVYVAYDARLQREVALDVDSQVGGATVSHRSVVKVFDTGRDGGRSFTAMELVVGERLATRLARASWREQASWFEQIARGLAAAHAAGVSHRGFTLDDVLVETDTGRVVVLHVGAPLDASRDLVALATALPDPPRAPSRLVAALEQGRRGGWPSLDHFANAIAAVHGRRRGAVAVIGIGAVALGSLAFVQTRSGAERPCAAGLADLDAAAHRQAIVIALMSDPAGLARAAAAIDDNIVQWRVAHVATCVASRSPPQAPDVAECLEARRAELAALTSDIVAGEPHAVEMLDYAGEPTICIHPPASATHLRVLLDRTMRVQAARLRHRIREVERTRADDMPRAIELATALVADAATAPPMIRAEVLYALGATQSLGGGAKDAMKNLREAAALAGQAHDDFTVEEAWIQLAFTSSGDEGDQPRAFEYLAYADAALERLGRPAKDDALFSFAKGTVLVASERFAEAEVVFRRAIDLSERSSRETLAASIQGLAYLYDSQGRIKDAIRTYREALTHLDAANDGKSLLPSIESRLAVEMSSAGDTRGAIAIGRDAVARSDKMLAADNVDRMFAHGALAQALDDDHLGDEALAEAHDMVQVALRSGGERSERYAEGLIVEASMLVERDRCREALVMIAKSCHILEFLTEPDSIFRGECKFAEGWALDGLQQYAPALVLFDSVVPNFQKGYGPHHPQVAVALLERGKAHAGLGHHARAVADFEAALELFDHSDIDPRYGAATRAALGKELWSTDRPRATQLLSAAVTTLEPSPAKFTKQLAESEALLH